MDRIEFIGTYYVGKSTLYKAYSEQIEKSSKYIVEEGVRKVARKEMGIFTFYCRSILMRVFQIFGGSLNVYKIPEPFNFQNDILENYKHTLAICFQNENILSTKYSLIHKTFARLTNLIARYQFYDSLNLNKTLLTEESIIHWHQVLHDLLLDENFVFSEDQLKDKGLFPKALIYCYADSKLIFERMKMRKNSNQLNVPDMDQKLDEVLSKLILKQEVLLKYSQIAEENGVGVLRINTDEPIEKNVMKINSFLQKL
ncbi:MAG TPA: hypothetical protein VLZ83_02160 [Edaphocola sp.]|nr:hypothetical protein [Edaphocola sp.]